MRIKEIVHVHHVLSVNVILCRTCLPYLSTDKQHAAKQVIDDPEMTVNYKEYDWSLNEKFDGKL